MRKALVIGINYYEKLSELFGCVNDAHEVKSVLERHSDGSVNFSVLTMIASNRATAVTRATMKDKIIELFAGDSDIALLYFAGHGHIEATGGYLCGSDCERGDDGLSLAEVIAIANKSKSRNKVVILDSCFSGIAGTGADQQTAELSEGLTILTASTKDQYASEVNNSGVFTELLVDALNGAAANLVGDVTPGSVYAHIDQSLGPWKQRPIFRTNVKSFVSLRKTTPPIDIADLKAIPKLFPTPGFEFPLDPSFEPEMAGRPQGAQHPKKENTEVFARLQRLNRVNLLRPVDATHMWNAAMESKPCKLTVLGEHYRRLAEQELI
ncbi:caspase family protein [Arenimonas sp. SCN 70-307]|uniref:caspase family protein n=1 Tax=Arenimonas sp. SCN 70-307 TaxID=1660089 RepID=UPI000ABB3125|nr:caspase family protein [Arenimonas sp. SCN 70-307]